MDRAYRKQKYNEIMMSLMSLDEKLEYEHVLELKPFKKLIIMMNLYLDEAMEFEGEMDIDEIPQYKIVYRFTKSSSPKHRTQVLLKPNY